MNLNMLFEGGIMAKKCPITLNNGAVTCFMYGDIEVQAPAIADKNATEVEVEYKDGKYTIVEDKKKETVIEDVKTEDKKEDVKTDSHTDYNKGNTNKQYFKANK